MSDLFRVIVDLPDDETGVPGKIQISCMRPDIYFGFQYYDHYVSRLDKEHQQSCKESEQ